MHNPKTTTKPMSISKRQQLDARENGQLFLVGVIKKSYTIQGGRGTAISGNEEVIGLVKWSDKVAELGDRFNLDNYSKIRTVVGAKV